MSNLSKNRRLSDEETRAVVERRRDHDDYCPDAPSEISLTIDGVGLVLNTCSTCGYRSWRREGELVELSDVLADVTDADTRYRRGLQHAS
jgi:hypothetical protein